MLRPTRVRWRGGPCGATALRRREEAVTMKRGLLVGAGALIALAGVIFTLQGVGAIGGSAISGDPLWAVAGAETIGVFQIARPGGEVEQGRPPDRAAGWSSQQRLLQHSVIESLQIVRTCRTR